MNKTLKSLFLVGLLCVFASLGFAQTGATALTQTTLAAAVADGTGTFLRVTSATGIVAGTTVLYIEDGTGGDAAGTPEAVFVNSVNGTTIGVTRGYYGLAGPHISGAGVLIGAPAAFVNVEQSGSCTAANTFNPTINLKTGNQWICSSITSSWVPGFFNTASQASVTTAVASVAGATNPSGPLFHVTGTNAITAWGSSTTVGLGGGFGSKTDVVGSNFCVIPDAIFTTTATNNIALASTAVVNKLLCFTFDATNKKYVPSY